MADDLTGHKIAVLATDGFEQVELTSPVEALKKAGADVHIVSPKSGTIQGYNHRDRADAIPVDRPLGDAKPDDYDALVLPGGVINPDALRLEPQAIEFVRHFVQAKKPIGAICHGPWILIDAGGAKGMKVTSWPSLKTDLTNAGAFWSDAEVVTDHGLVTSRKPADLPAFNKKLIEEIREGRHEHRKIQSA